MYIPSYYKQEDQTKLLAFMNEFPFAILVTAEENKPWATHIPFVIEEEGGKVVLYSHISAMNPQKKQLLNTKVLVIFREPHAYISPSLYNSQKNVPTWNYVAVHAYGNVELIEGEKELIELQEKMIQMLEPSYMEQFKNLDKKYLDDLLKGITGFRITVDELFGKEKLNQNKTDEEIERIAKHLLDSTDSTQKKIGDYMFKK